MVPPIQKRRRVALGKLQQLRSVANSHAQTSASILHDASTYIQELLQKIEDIVEDNDSYHKNKNEDRLTQSWVTVEAQEKSFLVRVFSKKTGPHLLVSILSAFEDLGIDVIDARVSCAESFRLEAIGREKEGTGEVDSEMVKEAMLQAVRNSS
ncbi:uncharacterized protein LOC144706670 [Wolffia australiana]